MPPEIQQALIGLAVIIITVTGIGITGIGLYLKASFERRVKKMNEKADAERKEHEIKLEEERLDREAKRTREREEMNLAIAKAQTEAEEAKATHEQAINLTSAVMKLVQTHSDEQHATRGVLTNQAQSIGDMGQSIDRMATTIHENTVVTRATGSKSDNVVTAVNELKGIMTAGVDRIIQLLSEDANGEDKKIA